MIEERVMILAMIVEMVFDKVLMLNVFVQVVTNSMFMLIPFVLYLKTMLVFTLYGLKRALVTITFL